MTSLEAITTGIRKSFVAEGRASRPEFWWLWAFHFVVPCLLILATALVASFVPVWTLQALLIGSVCLYLGTIPSAFFGMIRRQHDTGRTGILSAIVYLLVISLIVAVICVLWYVLRSSVTVEMVGSVSEEPNPLLWFSLMPVLLIGGLFDAVLAFILLCAVGMTIGMPLMICFLILIFGLAQPSEEGTNAYGPNPAEARS